jgi:hypothetical protein
MLDIKQWSKTVEGIQTIETQKTFCIGGVIWQGYMKTPVRVRETQLSDDEMKAVLDMDGTMNQAWVDRKRRIESRYERKAGEYSERGHKIRQEIQSIRNSIKEDKELGIVASEYDLAEISRLRKRQDRLRQLAEAKSMDLAEEMVVKTSAPVEVDEVAPIVAATPDDPVQCTVADAAGNICGVWSPEGHLNPMKWLRGHKVGKHRMTHSEQRDQEAAVEQAVVVE